jgi:thiol-disulfide isomerase/thioredoxin
MSLAVVFLLAFGLFMPLRALTLHQLDAADWDMNVGRPNLALTKHTFVGFKAKGCDACERMAAIYQEVAEQWINTEEPLEMAQIDVSPKTPRVTIKILHKIMGLPRIGFFPCDACATGPIWMKWGRPGEAKEHGPFNKTDLDMAPWNSEKDCDLMDLWKPEPAVSIGNCISAWIRKQIANLHMSCTCGTPNSRDEL